MHGAVDKRAQGLAACLEVRGLRACLYGLGKGHLGMGEFLFGSDTQTQEIPEWVTKASKEALAKSNAAADIGYTPYMGPEVAAFSPAQEAYFNNNASIANSVGLAAPQGNYMPAAQEFGGGVRGHGSYAGFADAMDRFRRERPGQAGMVDSFSIDPVTGEFAANTYGAQQQQRIEQEMMRNAGGGGGGSDRDYSRPYSGGGGDRFQGPNRNGDVGYGAGGYTSVRDMFDGGGAGVSGGAYSGGGLLSDVGNRLADRFGSRR